MTTTEQQPGISNRIVRCFAAGAFAVLPLLLTVMAISWSISFMAGLVGPDTFLGGLLSKIGLKFVSNSNFAYIAGWLSLGVIIFVVGFLVESGMRELFKKLADAILKRIPLIGKVYDTSQQLVDMLDTGGDDKLQGMSVAYCTFAEGGGVGVLALLPTKEEININSRPHHIVLVPQSPVPIGGGLLFIPVEYVEHVDMSVDHPDVDLHVDGSRRPRQDELSVSSRLQAARNIFMLSVHSPVGFHNRKR